MKPSIRLACVFAATAFMACISPNLFAQTDKNTRPIAPGYSKMAPVAMNSIRTLSPSPVLVYPVGAVSSKGHIVFDQNGASVSRHGANANAATSANAAVIGNGTLFGLDTVTTFEGAFAATGGPSMGQVFPYIMMGNNPLLGGKTEIPAKITTVSLQLLNPDGTVGQVVSYNPFEDITLDSPVFQNALYGDGRSQFTDAIQRAEFFNTMKPNWHTELDPAVVDRVTIPVPRFVDVQFPDGTIKQVQNYYVGKAPNGDSFVELLDLFFNSIFFNQAVNDINGGNYTTDAFNMQFYPNTFLFSIDNSGNFASCCVLGFHNYIYEPGADTPHTLTVQVSGDCPNTTTQQDAVVSGVSLDVIRHQ